jgi:decaprenylphospho-beta-D-ribofuranose 2-oxidase
VPSLAAMIDGLREAGAAWPYTVGWIDCLSRGRGLGRGVLMRGRHATRAEAGDRPPRRRGARRVPVDAPEWLLSPLFVRAFNAVYYRLHGGRRRRRLVSYDAFFYPLDAVQDWNRLYGRRGFLQYQCVLPRADGLDALAGLMEHLAGSGAASFLAVIKDCGPESGAYLSFPMEGTTLALDLPYRAGGRVYLAKDAVTTAEDFARMTPRLAEWRAVRDHWDPDHRFRTAQSARLLGD